MPKHVRAARALLAWKQSDLARAASVATSTIADFERGSGRRSRTTPLPIRDALEVQGIRFLPGGVVGSSHALAPVIPKPGHPCAGSKRTTQRNRAEPVTARPRRPNSLAVSSSRSMDPTAVRGPSDDSIQYAG